MNTTMKRALALILGSSLVLAAVLAMFQQTRVWLRVQPKIFDNTENVLESASLPDFDIKLTVNAVNQPAVQWHATNDEANTDYVIEVLGGSDFRLNITIPRSALDIDIGTKRALRLSSEEWTLTAGSMYSARVLPIPAKSGDGKETMWSRWSESLTVLSKSERCNDFDFVGLTIASRTPLLTNYVPEVDQCQNLVRGSDCKLQCQIGSKQVGSGHPSAKCSDSGKWAVPRITRSFPLVAAGSPALAGCVPDMHPSNFKSPSHCPLSMVPGECRCGLKRNADGVHNYFLHIPKTGGLSVRGLLHVEYGCEMLRQKKIHTGGHQFYLGNGHPTSTYFFFVRDPVTRVSSAFYFMMRCEEPAFRACGNAHFFKPFGTLNNLAEAMCSEDSDERARARFAFDVKHMKSGVFAYMSNGFQRNDEETFKFMKKMTDEKRIVFVGRTSRQHFLDDYHKLTVALGLTAADKFRNASMAEIHSNSAAEYMLGKKSMFLSSLARRVLRYELDREYRTLRVLHDLGLADLSDYAFVPDYERVDELPCKQYPIRGKLRAW